MANNMEKHLYHSSICRPCNSLLFSVFLCVFLCDSVANNTINSCYSLIRVIRDSHMPPICSQARFYNALQAKTTPKLHQNYTKITLAHFPSLYHLPRTRAPSPAGGSFSSVPPDRLRTSWRCPVLSVLSRRAISAIDPASAFP